MFALDGLALGVKMAEGILAQWFHEQRDHSLAVVQSSRCIKPSYVSPNAVRFRPAMRRRLESVYQTRG